MAQVIETYESSTLSALTNSSHTHELAERARAREKKSYKYNFTLKRHSSLSESATCRTAKDEWIRWDGELTMCKWWDALCSELHKKRPLILLSASFGIIIVWTSFRLMIICRDDAMMNVQECREFPFYTTKSLKLLHESTWTIFLNNFALWCLPAAACSCLRRPHRNTRNKNWGQERNQSREKQKFHRNGISSVEISKCPVVTFSKISRIFFSVCFSFSFSLSVSARCPELDSRVLTLCLLPLLLFFLFFFAKRPHTEEWVA